MLKTDLIPDKIFGYAEMHIGKQSIISTTAAYSGQPSNFVLIPMPAFFVRVLYCFLQLQFVFWQMKALA